MCAPAVHPRSLHPSDGCPDVPAVCEKRRECHKTNRGSSIRLYDNKGMLAAAARILGLDGRKALLEKVGRLLGGKEDANKALRKELAEALPAISWRSGL